MRRRTLSQAWAWLPVLFILLAAPAVWADANFQNPCYQAAVADAKVALPSEISTSLWAINAYNDNLIWEGAPGSSRVLMVSWLSGDYYDSSLGGNYLLPDWLSLWVTAAPALKQYYVIEGRPTKQRVEQTLGMPPGTDNDRFVEFWVDLDDLFRPSPDPEISDHEAQLDFPGGQVTVSNWYQDWFNDLKAVQYNQPTPYPWTRLGYTYDWGRSDHVGPSEFVIRGGSTLGVYSITSTLGYFQ